MSERASAILRWPAWLRFGLLGALPIFSITGSRMAWVVVMGRAAQATEAGAVLAKATAAGFAGGAAYGLLGRPFARYGRIGSTVAGAIAMFTYLFACSLAFPLRRVDGFVIGFGIALSLVGGWILNPGGMEREFVAERVPLLGWFARGARLDPRTAGAADITAALRTFSAAPLELGRGGAADDAEVEDERGDDPLAGIRSELAWLRAGTPRTRETAVRALFGVSMDGRAIDGFLEDVDAALQTLETPTR